MTGSQVAKYYFAGATRIAMRKYTIPQNMTVEYLLTDHLGSTNLTTDTNGAKVSEMRYKPWGEVRYTWTASLSTTPAYELTKYTFTGQFSYMDDPSTAGVTEGFGLMFYNARWYDPVSGRFAQADSIVPTSTQGTQAWDRYAFVNNNPVRYTDPTGHFVNILIGIAIGAVVGGVAGGIISYAQTGSVNWNMVGAGALAGGIAGGIIATGVGLLAAPTLTTTGLATAGTELAGAAETANIACGGDMCASEIQDASSAIQEALPVVESQSSQLTNTINTGINTVYRYVENGVTKYYGITNDFERRAAEWNRAMGWRIEPIPGLRDNLSRFDARAVEQVLIEQTGLSNLYNQINSIATSNPIYTQAMQRGTEILRIIGAIPR